MQSLFFCYGSRTKKRKKEKRSSRKERLTLSNCLQANSSSWLTSTGSRLITGLDIVFTLDSTISAPYYKLLLLVSNYSKKIISVTIYLFWGREKEKRGFEGKEGGERNTHFYHPWWSFPLLVYTKSRIYEWDMRHAFHKSRRIGSFWISCIMSRRSCYIYNDFNDTNQWKGWKGWREGGEREEGVGPNLYCFSCRPKPWQRFWRFLHGHRDRRRWTS